MSEFFCPPCRCVLRLLVLPMVLLASCATQPTESDASPKSRLYENTMGFELGDFSKRSEFDGLREESQNSPLMQKRFVTDDSRVQGQAFDAGTSRFAKKGFETGDAARDAEVAATPSLTGKRARLRGNDYRDAATNFVSPDLPGRWRLPSKYATGRYDSAPKRQVETWQSDSLPPRIIQTPDSDADLSSLRSVDDLRATLGK